MVSTTTKTQKSRFETKPIATISAKYQLVIPKAVRASMKLKPGDQVCFLNINGSMRLVPIRPIAEYRGILRGAKIDAGEIREKKDRPI